MDFSNGYYNRLPKVKKPLHKPKATAVYPTPRKPMPKGLGNGFFTFGHGFLLLLKVKML
jgi:hypothetical protein